MIGNRVCINFCDRTFLSADTTRKIAKMINGKWDICRHRFPDRFTVIPGFNYRQPLKMGLHAIRYAD